MVLESDKPVLRSGSHTPRAGGGFKLINYDPVCKDATYSTRVMRTVGRNGPQVNVKFSVKPEGGLAIDGFDIFEKGVKVELSSQDDKYWARAFGAERAARGRDRAAAGARARTAPTPSAPSA